MNDALLACEDCEKGIYARYHSSNKNRDKWNSTDDLPHPRLLCPDLAITRFGSGEYGLAVQDGTGSHIVIKYCPFCGTKLK